jgi:hypothetical protein
MRKNTTVPKKKSTPVKRQLRKPKSKNKLRWTMEFEGITSRYLYKRITTQLNERQFAMALAHTSELPESERNQICDVMNRHYDEIFGHVRPISAIMIAVPQRPKSQAQA